MADKSEIQKFINHQNSLDTLRFITCGSVDDGKSTLYFKEQEISVSQFSIQFFQFTKCFYE